MDIKRIKEKFLLLQYFFESMPYQVNPHTGVIDYDRLEENAALFRPKLIVCGGSAYPREWDYERFRKIADKVGAYLMADIAHISGLVAAGEAANPFQYCDVVTSTTHKSLRGPRAGIIFYRKGKKPNSDQLYDFESKISFSVFPSLQGGPHEHTIAAIATAFKEANTPEFKLYAIQIKKNAKALAAKLIELGNSVVTGGTDNHIVLWDVRPQNLTGNLLEKLFEQANISVNKNTIYGDTNAFAPGGVRLGTPALTTRGFKESDFEKVAEFLHRGAKICSDIKAKTGAKTTKDFVPHLPNNEDIKKLREDVAQFARTFPMPGV